MQDKKDKEVEGLLWGEGTICNVRWGGVPLRDLLLRAGVRALAQSADLRVCFASHVTVCQEDEWFGASIPLEKVMDKDGGVLLAYMVEIPQPITPKLDL
ncbi:hypothetical protein PHLCEN_2v12740 [Hermanssonia centrifuga]|uniref:Oxidoreductase molybdopterin-binding domain-containing protein n=1 Tax=Hermanssonia centrifuga TaxID=98765 RepID=A0A2R6NG61_9APHY|nr:hypothetical protein PHLCEN_2v12740 [Hermanssonia centrifuga]